MPRLENYHNYGNVPSEVNTQNRGFEHSPVILRSEQRTEAVDMHGDRHKRNQREEPYILTPSYNAVQPRAPDRLRRCKGYELVNKIRVLAFMIRVNMMLAMLWNPPSYANSEGQIRS
jgi:hypothetical protein